MKSIHQFEGVGTTAGSLAGAGQAFHHIAVLDDAREVVASLSRTDNL